MLHLIYQRLKIPINKTMKLLFRIIFNKIFSKDKNIMNK